MHLRREAGRRVTVRPAESKHSVLCALLREGMVLVALDARAAQVWVPPHLQRDMQLRLNLSHRFGLPLHLDAWGVHATLTFAGCAFACAIPWSAIFLFVSHVDGQPYLFVEDIPAELLAPAPPRPTGGPAAPSWARRPCWASKADASASRTTEAKDARQLALVEPPPDKARAAAKGAAASAQGVAHPRARASARHLRLVK